jgi:hypothetical protein
MNYIRRLALAGFFLLAAQSATFAAIVGDGANMTWDSTHLYANCKVTQTAGAADHAAYPGGKGYYCEINGGFMGGNSLCTTNAPAGHFCGGTSNRYNGIDFFTFRNYAYGNDGSDWVYAGERGNALSCSGYPSTSCAFAGAW